MAKVNYNVVTHGLSGKVGELLLFIQRHGRTFVGKIPSRKDAATPEQLAVRNKFQLASRYAKACMQDENKKALYAERAGAGVTAFNLALADFCVSPEITEINTTEYTGVVGSIIKIMATDDTKVTGVTVRIETAGGSLIEEGDAVQEPGTDEWKFATSVANPSITGSRVIAKATDLPGNESSLEKVI